MTIQRRRTRSPRGSGELLADEIIDAATDLLLDEADASAVSIRAVATRVGVTPPSIYLHFADKDALLDAVCAHYFEQLDEKLADAEAGVGDPLERALSLGMAYIRFALSTPVLYRQAFSRVTADTPTRVDEVLATSAVVRFSRTVTELAEAGMFEAGEVADIVLEWWSAAHGIASLMISKPSLNWGDDLERAETMLRSMCVGRAVMGVTAACEPDEVRRLLSELSTR
ncbi:TetR/AcrR family transcriptional regulator [Gordonia polyisoprenivorans]|uniref:TetR/AcrR family transcriptional regulator n=1 Tax=Gordonia polyisoprenivorans TaxID=84595 RepID=UPI00031848D4|nr:TetR/AcrR family transcriptional regulator [Gordonia polyisoprenivorans]